MGPYGPSLWRTSVKGIIRHIVLKTHFKEVFRLFALCFLRETNQANIVPPLAVFHVSELICMSILTVDILHFMLQRADYILQVTNSLFSFSSPFSNGLYILL